MGGRLDAWRIDYWTFDLGRLTPDNPRRENSNHLPISGSLSYCENLDLKGLPQNPGRRVSPYELNFTKYDENTTSSILSDVIGPGGLFNRDRGVRPGINRHSEQQFYPDVRSQEVI